MADGYPSDGTSSPLSWSLVAKLYASPGPIEGSGYYLPQVTDKLSQKIEGTCD